MTEPTQSASPSETELSGVAELAQGAGLGLVGKLGGRLLNLVTQVLLARWLGPANFGLYSIGWNIQRALAPLAALGLDQGVIRYGADREDRIEPRTVKASLWLGLIASAAIGALLFLGAGQLAGAFGKPGLATVLRWFASAVPLWATIQISLAATRIRRDVRPTVWVEEVALPLANLGLAALLLALGYELLGALGALVLALTVALLLSLRFLRRMSPRPDSSPSVDGAFARRLLAYSLPVGLAGLLSAWLGWVDRLAVGYYLSAESAGIYQSSVQLSLIFLLILASFNRIFAPLVVRYRSANDGAELARIYRLATKWGLYMALPLLVFIVITAPGLLGTLYGAAYRAGAAALVVLSLGQVINLATGGVGLLLILSDQQGLWLRITGTAGLLGLLLNVWLVPRFGLAGAAASAALALALLFLWGLLAVRRRLGLWPYDAQFLKGLAAAVFSWGIVSLIPGFRSAESLLMLILAGLACAGLFLGLLGLFGLTDEDRDFLAVLRTRLLKLS